jgi:KamA family protein
MKFVNYTLSNLRKIEYLKSLPEQEVREIEIVAKVLPFKTNNYVVDYLIDWKNYKTDPLFILNFPSKDMLEVEQYNELSKAISDGRAEEEIKKIIRNIRMQLNPHPAQQESNIPLLDDQPLPGVQHKYSDIILFFPSQGQTCHAHCTFCFRWPQFVGDEQLQFSMKETSQVIEYVRRHSEVNEILFTGGDPMVMSPAVIRKYIAPILDASLPNLKIIRFGTKSLTYWPFAFISGFSDEAEEMLSLFREICDRGYHLAFMAHFNHVNELNNEIVEEAIHLIRSTGAEIRTQAPLLKNINDNPKIWSTMWKRQSELGMIPYYMFVERETGPYKYFQVPLERIFQIYQDAIRDSGSFSKTLTGPVMSATNGKVQIMSIFKEPMSGRQYFQLQYIRHRDNNLCYKPFLAEFDPIATWVDQLTMVGQQKVEVWSQ